MIYAALILHIHASPDVADFGLDDLEDHIHLLQLQAKKQNRSEVPGPVNHHYVFDSCATFGGAADIVGSGAFNPQAEDCTFGFCRCYGDTHCSAVPFDPLLVDANDGHYIYDGLGASRFAKAADGSWEMQTFQCGYRPATDPRPHHPSGQVGVAIKSGGTVVEVGTANRDDVQCYVNGVLKPAGYEVHLPTGFHFKCPENTVKTRHRPYRKINTAAYGTFCAVQDGQFVAATTHWEWGYQVNQVLAVPKNVDVQATNTVCYDPASKNGLGMGTNHQLPGKEMATTAVVAAEDVLFSQKLIDYMSSNPNCALEDPVQKAVPAGEPADPQEVCGDHGPDAWQHAQDVCSPLQERHMAFYNDCLIDECLRFGDKKADAEEAEIEEIAEADEPEVVDEASAIGDPHITSSSGSRFDLLPSMLKHSH